MIYQFAVLVKCVFLPIVVLHGPISGWPTTATIYRVVVFDEVYSKLDFATLLISAIVHGNGSGYFISTMTDSALSPTPQKLSHWRQLSPLSHPLQTCRYSRIYILKIDSHLDAFC